MKPLFLTSQRGLSEEKDSRLLLLLLFCKEKEKWTIKERKVRIRLFLSKKMSNKYFGFLKLSFSPSSIGH